jgi:flagellar motility protein MotE (MotC chaperone)
MKPRAAGRGALVMLALLLASSGAMRLGSNLGAAMANSSDGGAETTTDAPLDCPAPPLALSEALLEREAHLDSREAAIVSRMAALKLADEATSLRLAELKAAEEELRAVLALADGAAEADLTRLTAVYESMKPKDAAPLFEKMAPEFAAGFLGRMRPEAAGAILSGLPPDMAYSISAILAGRNATAPKD